MCYDSEIYGRCYLFKYISLLQLAFLKTKSWTKFLFDIPKKQLIKTEILLAAIYVYYLQIKWVEEKNQVFPTIIS